MTDEQQGRLRAYLDDELPDADRAEVEALLASSSGARAMLDELRELDASTSALLGVEASAPRTAAAWRAFEGSETSRASRRGLLAGAAALLAAGLLLVVLWPWSGAEDRGALTAERRESVAIGDRAIAVAEPASSLSWHVESSGRATVRQSSGAVFYRVNAGDDFVVETPAGSVTVTGTCFTVELSEMNTKSKYLASATAGAAVAAAITLTVHEGSVVLANERGDLEVGAGERAQARSGRAPYWSDADDEPESKVASASPFSTLVRENQEQRRQLRDLQTKVQELESNGQPEAKPEVDRESPEYRRAAGRQCGVNGNCDVKLWTDPSQEGLEELAKCGRILVDTPSFMGGGDVFPQGYVIEAAGLAEADAVRYAELAEQFQGDVGEDLAGLARELGLPSEVIERVSPVQLRGIVRSLADVDTRNAMQHRVADERAGLSAPPDSETADERALRYLWNLGDSFEQRLAEEFGPDAAREMRHAGGGWGHKSSLGTGICDD